MTTDTKSIWKIFLDLTDHLVELDEKENFIKDWNHLDDNDPAAYRLMNMWPSYDHEGVENHNFFKMMPLIDKEKVPTWMPSFDKLTKPNGRFNAYAIIGIGHRWDRYDTGDRNDGGDAPRFKAAKELIFPKFISDVNAFLASRELNGKPLKAEIVNGTFEYVGMNFFPYARYWGGEEPSYYQYIVPLAIKITYA